MCQSFEETKRVNRDGKIERRDENAYYNTYLVPAMVPGSLQHDHSFQKTHMAVRNCKEDSGRNCKRPGKRPHQRRNARAHSTSAGNKPGVRELGWWAVFIGQTKNIHIGSGVFQKHVLETMPKTEDRA